LLTPIYRPLAEAVEEYHRNLITVPLTLEDNKYLIDFDLLEKAFKSRSIKMFSMCNPHNPVGRVWTEIELKQLGDLCLSHNTLIVSDDIHCDLTAKNYRYIPIASLSNDYAMNSIILTSMTKTFNLSGLKISNIHIQNPELRKDFYKLLNKKFVYEPSVFGIIALMVAYSKCGPWADMLTNYLDENYQFIKNYINDHELNIDLIYREGTPTAWLDFRKTPLPYTEVFNFLVQKAGLIFVDGSFYTANGEGFQRMSIGFPRSRIQLAMECLKKALSDLS
jgi:cystathionine beta-lyase